MIDEVVIRVTTLEPWPAVEINCHGSRAGVEQIINLLVHEGAVRCSWGAFIQRQSANKPLATAIVALPNALTLRTASMLLDQFHGAWQLAIGMILEHCSRQEWEQVGQTLDELNERIPLGRHLTVPWRVVVAGAPNVGKSTLVNALIGYQRSIVTPVAGTTRDVVRTLIAIDGWPVELVDTAGVRSTGDAIEQEGVRLARGFAAEADCCIWVMDAAQEPTWPDGGLEHVHLVINKTDLSPIWNLADAASGIRISAQTGTGISEVTERLSRWLVPNPPSAGAAIPFTDEQRTALETARKCYLERRWASLEMTLRSIL
jgi:tRNA modification GTPase